MSELSLRQMKKEWHGSLKTYLIGFIASLIFTSISFYLVITKTLTGTPLVQTIVALALAQALVQLIFFLHVGQEPKPRWETMTFCFMVVILLVISIGSILIMNDLNARMMLDMNEMMKHD